tara:strand:- start:170 stop:565 length:396 start_codon:yes stop_codon:yes gene_type:complete
MAKQYRHARYFRKRLWADSSLITFSSVAEAKTLMDLSSAYDTNNPTKTETLEDSGRTLKIVYEFESASDQEGMKNAVDAVWSEDTWPYGHPGGDPESNPGKAGLAEHFKTEWYAGDGTTVESTSLWGNPRK